MPDVAIRHLHSRFRCPPGTDAQSRLRRILAEAVDSGLEAAMARRVLSATGEVCLREIGVQARLSLRETDSALAAELAQAIADAIAGGIGDGLSGCVHYASRAEALADFAAATLSGDFKRAWAWRQLGIGSSGFAVSVADAAGQVLKALITEPRQAVAILASVTEHPILFERLLSQGSRQHWLDLARSVAGALGASPDPAFRAEEGADHSGTGVLLAQRILAQSTIARALRSFQRPESLAGELSPAWAILVLGEVEPALLQAPKAQARAWVRAVALALASATASRTAGGLAAFGDAQLAARQAAAGVRIVPLESAPVTAPDNSDEDARALTEGKTGRATALSDGVASTLAASPEIASVAADSNPLRGGTAIPGISGKGRGGGSPPPKPVSADAGSELERRPDRIPLLPGRFDLPETRRRGHTRFGGLLYLVDLIGPTGVLERIRTDARLAARTPRWCLHRLALILAPVTESDPAALAFAGLMPGSEPPCANQPAATEAETGALAELCGQLLRALCERLDRPDEDEYTRLDYLCRRPAEILADPGWLEAHFALDQVATDIRAAGLDLDPGWVPWLGVVMRFLYV